MTTRTMTVTMPTDHEIVITREFNAPRRLVFSLLVDGARGGLETVPGDGAEITLMPPFAGG